MKNLLFLLISLSFISGCVSPDYSYRPEITEISQPPLNMVVTVFVGEAMVRQGKFAEHDAIYIKREIRVGALSSYRFAPGYYLKQGEDSNSEYYLPAIGPDGGRVIVSTLADPFQIIRVEKNSDRICGVSAFGLQACTNNGDFEKRKYPVASSDSFQQTLIYSGKVGDKINIGYREFSNNFARPAFSNEVEYQLSESNIIGYRGCRIEVIEATNEYIKYRVLSNFNRAEF